MSSCRPATWWSSSRFPNPGTSGRCASAARATPGCRGGSGSSGRWSRGGSPRDAGPGGVAPVIVLGIDTSTSQTSVALGAQGELVAAAQFAGVRKHDDVVPAVERLLEWTGIEL